MKHIKLFENFLTNIENEQVIDFTNQEQALDQLKEVWFDLEEPIETLRRRLNNREASIESIYADKDDLGLKVLGMVEKMKKICKDNGLDKTLQYTVNDISSVLPHNYMEVHMSGNKNKPSIDDFQSFGIGYKAYKKLIELINQFRTPQGP